MLPGLRFLFAAIMLSMSMLVFGLGAAALLRAAHEEFATNPSWHATPETMFAQRRDATRPVLAMLRVDDTPAVEQPASGSVPAAAPAGQASIEATPNEKMAALKPENSPPPETANPQIPIEAASAQGDAAPAPADTPAPPASAIETETAAVLSSASEPAATTPVQTTPPEQASVPKSPDTVASTRIAALNDPPVTIEPVVPGTKSDAKTVKIKKRKHARRKAHRRRIALGARVARPAPQPAPNNPFTQSTNQ